MIDDMDLLAFGPSPWGERQLALLIDRECTRGNSHVSVDTHAFVCDHTAMVTHKHPTFAFPAFQPVEMERITGMKPALIRDWRRRELIHPSLDSTTGRFPAVSVAEFLLLAKLSDHGIGPKKVFGWTRNFAGVILYYALDDLAAWNDAEAYEAWKADQIKTAPDRYLGVYPPPHGLRGISELTQAIHPAIGIVTIVDLKALGDHFRETAHQKLGLVEWTEGYEHG